MVDLAAQYGVAQETIRPDIVKPEEAGIDPDFGFSLQDIDEAVTAKAMIARADPRKFNKRGIAHMADFHRRTV